MYYNHHSQSISSQMFRDYFYSYKQKVPMANLIGTFFMRFGRLLTIHLL